MSAHRALKALVRKGLVETIGRTGRPLEYIRPTLAGLRALADDGLIVSDNYAGQAFPIAAPGYELQVSVSRTYWRLDADGYPLPESYTRQGNILNARKELRFVSQTWREWWQ